MNYYFQLYILNISNLKYVRNNTNLPKPICVTIEKFLNDKEIIEYVTKDSNEKVVSDSKPELEMISINTSRNHFFRPLRPFGKSSVISHVIRLHFG